MSLYSKIKWIASILLVFFIVLVTNLIDKQNFNRLSRSVTTMYEDRIVASDLIFEMSMLIRKKEIALIAADSSSLKSSSSKVNQELERLIQRYEQTKLTEKERLLLNKLKEEIANFQRLEKNNDGVNNRNSRLESAEQINQLLHDLSKIQLKEGKRQKLISKQAMDTIDLFTQSEMVFLIVMAILVQIIILYKSPSERNTSDK